MQNKSLNEMSESELLDYISDLQDRFSYYKQKNINLDLSRGKPNSDQVALSLPYLSNLNRIDHEVLIDLANYGLPFGIDSVRSIGSYLLGLPESNVIASGSSSLQLMHSCLVRGFVKGWQGESPQSAVSNRKFICLTPGYDRHFALTEYFGYENIQVELTDEGPDITLIKELVEHDDTIKGMWCVPQFSNPTGITYSNDVVQKLALLKPKAKDFKIFWDNAYAVHSFTEAYERVANIFELIKNTPMENKVIGFSSTSKITIPGSGVAFVGAYNAPLQEIIEQLSIERVCPDKLSQALHAQYLSSSETIEELMRKHANILRSKFDLVQQKLQELDGLGCATWTRPQGGYFVSLDVLQGSAKKVVSLAKRLGLALTDAGATYPHRSDPKDSNIRIAPSFATRDELESALDILVLCIKLVCAQTALENLQTN